LGLKRELPTATLFANISSLWEEIADALDTEKQVNFVKNYVDTTGLVLDLGCGSGRHTIFLSKSGYEVVGLDVSMDLLMIAKFKATEAGVSPALVRADMRFVPFRLRVFSAVMSLDSSFGYLPSEEEDLLSICEVAGTLAANGFFLIDVFNRERMLNRYGKRFIFDLWNWVFGLLRKLHMLSGFFRWREYPSFWMLQKRSAKAGPSLLRDLWVFRDKRTGKITVVKHVVRLYDFSQLKGLVEKAGLQVLEAFGSYEGEKQSKNSNRLILVAAKVSDQ